MPFWNLRVVMDELESEMASMEFLGASPGDSAGICGILE